MDKKLFTIIKECEDFKIIKNELQTKMQGQCYCVYNADKFLLDSFLEVLLECAYCEKDIKPCGNCAKCKQVANGNNVDICYFGAESGQIKKEQIEKLLDSAITKPFEYARKFLVIKNGDGLTEQCQNMLLKLLENLPAFDTVIILASGTQKILPTIRSRSRNFILHSLGMPALIQMIGTSERSLNIIKCTDANMGKALELEKTKEFDEIFKYGLTLLYNYERIDEIAKYSAYAVKHKEKMDLILLIVKGVFYMALHGEIECTYTKPVLAKIVEMLSKLEIDLGKRQNKLMIIDKMMIEMLKIKLKG